MRLAQAARKLSITTEDIVDFLEIRGITIEKDSNTKLEEEAVKLLYRYFEIEEESKTEELPSPEEIKPEATGDIIIEETEQESIEQEEEKVEKQNINLKEEKEETNEEEIQTAEKSEKVIKKSFKTVEEVLQDEGRGVDEDLVIKPAKVELKGLNVVGKIDLPEPKPKPKPEPEQKQETKLKPKKSYSQARKTPPKRNQKRELSPAEIRKREEEREARKRERIEKEKKKKREQFYKERILIPKQLEQKKKPKKKRSDEVERNELQKPQPKTLLGKFWRWLNT